MGVLLPYVLTNSYLGTQLQYFQGPFFINMN